MKSITVAELRQNPTAALDDVQQGEEYVVTRHRQPIAHLVPATSHSGTLIPAKSPGGSQLQQRPRRLTYDEAQARLGELEAEW